MTRPVHIPICRRLSACVVLFLVIVFAPAAAPAPTALGRLIQAIRAEMQPEEAMNFMRQVYSTDRWFTFPKFQETAEYLKQSMERIGLEDIEVLGAPADYQKVPASLGMWSGATPPEGVTAEIVNLSDADLPRIAQMHLKGKLVLMNQNPAGFKWALVKSGSLCAINTSTENLSLQDGHQWINAWGDQGWGFTKGSTPLLSFSISPREATMVRKLLADRGVLRVKAIVDSSYYSGVYPYVTGVIRGTGPEEVLTLGHSFEQGAQDNATGVAAMLESLATVNRLILSG